MHRTLPIAAAAAALFLLTACTPAAENAAPAETVEASASETVTPTPTPTADAAEAFGSTVTLDYAGSKWAVTIEAPTEARGQLLEMFPLEEQGTQYVVIPGTIERVEGPPVEPSSEVSVDIVVNNKTVQPEYLGTGDSFPGATYSLPETFAGGSAPFEQVFIVPADSSVRTVSVTVGMGEASTRVFFGEALDMGTQPAGGDSASADVDSMKYLWGEASQEQREETLADAGIKPGGPISDSAVAYVVERSNEVGIILDEAEAREFLEWAVQQ